MVGRAGPAVLEFNARFGDPEVQVLTMSLGEDLLPWLDACARGTLAPRPLEVLPGASVGVVLASPGYPAAPVTGGRITGADRIGGSCQVFHAGTAIRDGALVTAGGRVLTVCARGPTLAEARANVYGAVSRISFEGMQYRRDIGSRGLGTPRP
jgi:phosphoribosylamine--glycine ligase